MPSPHGTRICGSSDRSTSRSATCARFHHASTSAPDRRRPRSTPSSVRSSERRAAPRRPWRARGARRCTCRSRARRCRRGARPCRARPSSTPASGGTSRPGSIRSSTATSASCSAARSSTRSVVASSAMPSASAQALRAVRVGPSTTGTSAGCATGAGAAREPLVQVLRDHLVERVAAASCAARARDSGTPARAPMNASGSSVHHHANSSPPSPQPSRPNSVRRWYTMPSSSSSYSSMPRSGSCQHTSGLTSLWCCPVRSRVLVQRAARAGREAGPVQEDARAVDEPRPVVVLADLDPDALLLRPLAELPPSSSSSFAALLTSAWSLGPTRGRRRSSSPARARAPAR